MRLLGAEADDPADIVLSVLAQVVAGQRGPATIELVEAQQDAGHAGLAGAAAPDQGDPPPRLQAQVDTSQGPGAARPVAQPGVLQRHRPGRRRARGRRVGHGHRQRGDREDPPGRGQPALQALEGVGKRLHRLKGGERGQRQRRQPDAVQRARPHRRHGGGQDAGERHPGRRKLGSVQHAPE